MDRTKEDRKYQQSRNEWPKWRTAGIEAVEQELRQWGKLRQGQRAGS